nr:uncharacterized protein LOC127329615 [Lolium perenne]
MAWMVKARKSTRCDVLIRGVPRARDANPRTGAREGPRGRRGGGGGGGAGDEASLSKDGAAPELRLEGDASGVEEDEPGEGASPGEDGAAPELRLEGDAAASRQASARVSAWGHPRHGSRVTRRVSEAAPEPSSRARRRTTRQCPSPSSRAL